LLFIDANAINPTTAGALLGCEPTPVQIYCMLHTHKNNIKHHNNTILYLVGKLALTNTITTFVLRVGCILQYRDLIATAKSGVTFFYPAGTMSWFIRTRAWHIKLLGKPPLSSVKKVM